MKIGILYPRSTAYPGMMQDFMDGIRTLIKQEKLTDHLLLFSESIGFGGNEKEVYEKAEKLLVLDDADVLVAYVDLRVLETIKPLIYSSGKLVLVVNPGANYPGNWVPQPNILNLTLQHGFLSWLTGKIAGQLKNTNAVLATSFYDCGYLHSAAMIKSFATDGGKMMFNYVNKQRYDDAFEINQLIDYLVLDKTTSALLCIFDSLPASLFYSRLNNYPDAGNLHLFVSPMMLEKTAIENLDEGFKYTVDGYSPWLASVENNTNRSFVENYFQQTNRVASVFSLLGWETGLILKEILLQNTDSFIDGADIAIKLATVTFNSPRGKMKLDAETNYFISTVYKCSIKKNSATVSIEPFGIAEKEWAEFVSIPSEGVSSGWTNTYLCY
jgi:hypothetical protein